MVNLPGRFLKLSLAFLTLQGKGLLLGPMSGLPTSIDNMNPNNRFIVGLSSIPIADGVIAHSIVGVEGGGPPVDGGDGVVKYSSAYRRRRIGKDCARHSMQGNPETIQEVKRILDRARREPALIHGENSPKCPNDDDLGPNGMPIVVTGWMICSASILG